MNVPFLLTRCMHPKCSCNLKLITKTEKGEKLSQRKSQEGIILILAFSVYFWFEQIPHQNKLTKMIL